MEDDRFANVEKQISLLNGRLSDIDKHLSFMNSIVPIGTIIEYSGNNVPPDNWLECNGQAVSRINYPELLGVIGITYGFGDGLNNFNVPDRRGYVAVGIDSANSTGGRVTNSTAPTIALGKVFGEERHLLTDTEMPKTLGACASGQHAVLCPVILGHPNNSLGHPHNNMQPSIFMKYYIRAK